MKKHMIILTMLIFLIAGCADGSLSSEQSTLFQESTSSGQSSEGADIS